MCSSDLEAMVKQWRDWGRDGTMYVAVRYGGYRLAEVVSLMGEIKYAAAAQAVRRFARSAETNGTKRRYVAAMKRHLAEQ